MQVGHLERELGILAHEHARGMSGYEAFKTAAAALDWNALLAHLQAKDALINKLAEALEAAHAKIVVGGAGGWRDTIDQIRAALDATAQEKP